MKVLTNFIMDGGTLIHQDFPRFFATVKQKNEDGSIDLNIRLIDMPDTENQTPAYLADLARQAGEWYLKLN